MIIKNIALIIHLRNFIFFGVIILLLSCSDPMDVEENINIIPVKNDTLNLNGIKPLAIGNIWIYQTKIYDSTYTLQDSYVTIDSVIKDTIIDSAKWFETAFYPSLWQSNLNDGLRFRQYATGRPLLEWLEAKFPGIKGFSWQALSSQRTIESTDTLINVTAGRFNCYYYSDIAFKTDTGWEYSDIFFSPKIGLIKVETKREKFNKERYISATVELSTFTKK